MLSDSEIRNAVHRGALVVDPFDAGRVQPASLDVTLHPRLWVLRSEGPPLDPKRDTASDWFPVSMDRRGFRLMPGMFVLGSTTERFELSSVLLGQVEGKSSLGRLGLQVHSTAGYVDPGFRGQVTLELSCTQPRGVVLYPRMPVAQMAFDRIRAVSAPYAGKYVDQVGPTLSRYHRNWDAEEGQWR